MTQKTAPAENQRVKRPAWRRYPELAKSGMQLLRANRKLLRATVAQTKCRSVMDTLADAYEKARWGLALALLQADRKTPCTIHATLWPQEPPMLFDMDTVRKAEVLESWTDCYSCYDSDKEYVPRQATRHDLVCPMCLKVLDGGTRYSRETQKTYAIAINTRKMEKVDWHGEWETLVATFFLPRKKQILGVLGLESAEEVMR